MTKDKFMKEIVKKGNVIIELRGCDSYIDVYKLIDTYGPNEERIKADVLYRYGNPCNFLIGLSIGYLINESTNYFNHYIAVEEY